MSEFLAHRGKGILEKVIRGQIALATVGSAKLALETPLDVLAKGPEKTKSRDFQVHAAKLKVFLDVLEQLSKPETEFELAKFDVG